MTHRILVSSHRLLAVMAAAAALHIASGSALAQTAPTGTLRVTVVDPSGAVIVGATVTVSGGDDATRRATVATVRTSDTGVAVVPALMPGRYTLEAGFPGLEKGVLLAR